MVNFECLTTNPKHGIIGTYQEHKPCGYMLNVVRRIDKHANWHLHRGEDLMKQFVDKMTELKNDVFEKMNVNKPMDELKKKQKLEFNIHFYLYRN